MSDRSGVPPAAAVADGESGPDASVAPPEGGAVERDTSPMSEKDRLRQQEWAEAIAGLSFDEGRVTVIAWEAEEDDRELARALIREGDEHLNRNRRTEAVKSYASAVRAAPAMPQTYFSLGHAMVAKGKPHLAAASFRTVKELVPASVETRVGLAMALDQSGDRQAAVEEMTGAVELDPAHGFAHERLAIWLYYLHDYQQSWKHVQLARDAGHELPPQFMNLLASRMAEPGG